MKRLSSWSMIFSKTFYVDATKGVDLILISHEVRAALRESKVERGWVTILVPRPGGGLMMIDPAERAGISVPKDQARLLPKSLVLPFEKGKFASDPWQDLYLIDYDEAGRRREVQVSVWGEEKPAAAPGGPAAPQL